MTQPIVKSVLRHVDQRAASRQAKVETRNREHYLPPISVYRWWARRTEAISGALIDAAVHELKDREDLLVADPFAGGGVIPLAALLRGHAVYAQDLNPWVAKGLATMLRLPPAAELRLAREQLEILAAALLNRAYATTFSDRSAALISQTLRVAVACCSKCGHEHRLFPHALVSRTKRKELGGTSAVLACSHGHLFFGRSDRTSRCARCEEMVTADTTYLPKRIVTCPECGHVESLEQRARRGRWRWEVVLIERTNGRRRELGFPTSRELQKANDATWRGGRNLGRIPNSQETRVLRRHGFNKWEDLYPKRQRVVTDALLRLVAENFSNRSVRAALEMAVLGSTEMAGLLSRWDRFYLKSFESMSSHRFNFSTLVAEPNVFGAGLAGRGTVRRRLLLFERAANWMKKNEIDSSNFLALKTSDRRLRKRPASHAVIVSGSSERLLLPDKSVDVVVTDPPYHDDVQYHELSLPLRAWAGLSRRRGKGDAVAIPHSRDLEGHRKYRGALTRIFKELRRVLKPQGRLLFSYANRESAAWVNLFAALRAAGFQPVGYTIVHSENETDHLKRKGRAFRYDLILELVPEGEVRIQQHKPKQKVRSNDEERYLRAVGDAFLRSGTLVNGWEVELVDALKCEIFVSDLKLAKVNKIDSHKKETNDAKPHIDAPARSEKRLAGSISVVGAISLRPSRKRPVIGGSTY
jgi:adenine-specific DNA methylase